MYLYFQTARTANDVELVVHQPTFFERVQDEELGLEWPANETTELDLTVEER